MNVFAFTASLSALPLITEFRRLSLGEYGAARGTT